jgi:hypothetical protein
MGLPRRAVVAALVVWVAVTGLALFVFSRLGDVAGADAVQIVAVLILGVLFGAFFATFALYVVGGLEDVGKATSKAHAPASNVASLPPAKGSRLRDVASIVPWSSGIIFALLTVCFAADQGASLFTSLTLPALALGALAAGLLFAVFVTAGPTPASVRAKEDRRRARRSRPRDLVILGESTQKARAGWYRLIRRRFTRMRLTRPLLGLVFAGVVFVFGYVEFNGYEVFPSWVAWSVGGLSAVLTLVNLFMNDAALGNDPELLIARVVSGVHVRELDRKTKGSILDWVTKGSSRLVNVEVERSVRLTSDGRVVWSGRRTAPTTISASGAGPAPPLGKKNRPREELVEGERCVLICDTRGLIVDTLGAFFDHLQRTEPADEA